MTISSTLVRSRNSSVDSFRLLAALGVIILHLEYPNVPGEIAIGLRLMSRWAIPFFFIISGYFLAANHARSNRVDVQPAVERLIWIFLLWSFIYAIVVAGQYDPGTSIKRIVSPYFIYFGNFIHLWFIPSLLFGYLMVAFCYNRNLKILLIVLSVLATVTALLSASYSIVDLGLPLDLAAASIWLSIPFLYIGFLLYKRGHPSWWVSVTLIMIGAGLQVFEARWLYDAFGSSPYEHEFLIGTVPFGIGMAGLALSDLKFLRHPVLANWGRDYSLGIYLIHPLIAMGVSRLMGSTLPEMLNNSIWQLCSPLIVIAVCIILFEVLQRYFPSGFNFLLGKRPKADQ